MVSKLKSGEALLAQLHFLLWTDPKNFSYLREFEFLNSVVFFFMVKKSTFLLELLVAPLNIAFDGVVVSVDVKVLEKVTALAEHAATEVALESAEAHVVQSQVPSQDKALRVHLVTVR